MSHEEMICRLENIYSALAPQDGATYQRSGELRKIDKFQLRRFSEGGHSERDFDSSTFTTVRMILAEDGRKKERV